MAMDSVETWSPVGFFLEAGDFMGRLSRARAGVRALLAVAQPDVVSHSLGVDGWMVSCVHRHDAAAFTQGLAFADGALYESTGLWGASTLRRIEVASGRIVQLHRLDPNDFGEGIAVVGDRIVQLTWHGGKGLIYDRRTLSPIDTFRYRGEGWGLAFDGHRLILSDGTSRLRLLDPRSFVETGQIEVRSEGRGIEGLNDLEVAMGEIIVNVYPSNRLARVSSDGTVMGWIDVQALRALPGMRGVDQVTNGVAWDPVRSRLFLTGKFWPRLFEVAPPCSLEPRVRDAGAGQ